MRTSGIEQQYINRIDQGKNRNPELKGQGFPAEHATLDFFEHMGLEPRFSTPSEDEGGTDIGPKLTIDQVVYENKNPILAPQITTSSSERVRQAKMAELAKKPFVRLDGMNKDATAIPKVLIYLDAQRVHDYTKNPDFSNHPELALQILNSILLSLQFDVIRTKNPAEQKIAQDLIAKFDREKQKYIH